MTPHPAQASGLVSAWRPAALLAGLLCCVYLLSATGVFRVDDEHILAARAQSLALRGRFEEPQVFGNTRAQALTALGDQATQIEPLQTVLGAGLYRLGVAVGLGGAQAMLTLNLYATALTAVIVFLMVLALGMERRIAIWCALLFGLATMAMPYASTFLRDSPAMAMTALAFLGWALTLRPERLWRVSGAAAIALGLAGGILTKNTVWAVALALAAAWITRTAGQGSRRRTGFAIAGALCAGMILTILILPGTGPLARFSAGYYGFLLSHFIRSLTPSLAVEVAGPFLSPAKSIFLFSPVLVLAIHGSFVGWRTGRNFILPAWLTALFLALGQALFYRDLWAGTFGWGLRFMLPALPALMAVAGWSVGNLLAGSRAQRAVLSAIVLIGAVVQTAGAWVGWNRVYAVWAARGLDPFEPSAAWAPTFLAIPPQIGMLFDSTTRSAAWYRLQAAGEGRALLVPGIGIALLILIVWRLFKELDRPGRRAGMYAVVLAAAAFVLPVWPTLAIYRGDAAFGDGAAQRVVERIRQEVEPGDVVVIDPYASPLWAAMINTWSSPAPWYSLPIVLPGASAGEVAAAPASEVVDLFNRLLDSSSTVWYLAAGEVPPGSRETKLWWLDEHAALETEIALGGVSPAIVLRGYRRD